MILDALSRPLDPVTKWWESRAARIARCAALGIGFVLSIALIEVNRLTGALGEAFPTNHLVAISWTVTLLLVFEIVDMVLSLQQSVASSVGRHLQVYALLLLRDAFAKLGSLPEPITITPEQYNVLGIMVADAGAALLVFAGATWFSKLQKHRPIVDESDAKARFVAIKKLIALALLLTFTGLCVRDIALTATGTQTHEAFDHFFTVLIFADVLLAVVSLGFVSTPPIVFRNFGFAFGAIILRLSVASPEYLRPCLGVGGAIVAILVTIAYNWAMEEEDAANGFEDERDL